MLRKTAGHRQTRSDEGRTTMSSCVRPRGRSEMVRPRQLNAGVVEPTTTETEMGDHHRDGDRDGDGRVRERKRTDEKTGGGGFVRDLEMKKKEERGGVATR
ncbi:NBS-LRR type resistance protein [Cucumis melo var. makuwa]|uniref:NBS-LRR type resistance protein n=1 Tax=Cucumis melo var. makuwa TaxID=1194695 RepID=A0A5D3BG73_CUCMM|nr:NBS-LRR type resistance protein [Cucumis melo var. makuwa]